MNKEKSKMNYVYSIESVIKDINEHISPESRTEWIEMAKKKREELNDTEWNHWVNDFIP